MPDLSNDSEGGKTLPLLLHALHKGSLVTRNRRIKLAFLISCLTCCGLLTGLVVTAALWSCSLLSIRSGQQDPIFITLAVNGSGAQLCQRPLPSLPCVIDEELMMTNGTSPLGPLYFTSDSVTPGTAASNCANCPHFQLTTDKLGLVVPVAGVYKVFSQIVFHDTIDAYVQAAVLIHPMKRWQLCQLRRVPGCFESGKDASFKWLSCQTHHKKTGGSELTQCTMDGVRRFHAGDVLSFVVGEDFRRFRLDPSVTHFYIFKL